MTVALARYGARTINPSRLSAARYGQAVTRP
jgi:hypothetical protein